MEPPPLPLTLPYASRVEHDFARARLVAALITGPAGVLLLLVSAGRWMLGVLGLLCILGAVGWLMATRRGHRRGRERASWQLALTEEALTLSTEDGLQRVLRGQIRALTLDEDLLQVVITRESAEELRLEATWGNFGAVDLHALLSAWWRSDGRQEAPDN